jgi:hypothetical protein
MSDLRSSPDIMFEAYGNRDRLSRVDAFEALVVMLGAAFVVACLGALFELLV